MTAVHATLRPRVGLVWPSDYPLRKISVRYERYVRGFRALGTDPVTIALPAAAAGYEEPVATVPNDGALRDPMFYRSLGLDAAMVVTWLGLPDVVGALKKACPWVVSIADSDGQVDVRAHPGPTFTRMTAQHASWGAKIRAAKYWLQLYLFGLEAEGRQALASAEHVDRIAIFSPHAQAALRRFFERQQRPDLAAKVIVAPYPIDDCYLTAPVDGPRENRVVAIGRWDDPQKDAGLLTRAAARFVAAGGNAEITVCGPAGECFAPLARQYPRLKYLGVRPPAELAGLLRRSRVLLLPSRWESGPIVLGEALASGCTVVGTDRVPSVLSTCAEGPFGQVSRPRSVDFAEALRRELKTWDRGDRDPVAIAAHWRPRFDAARVCRQLLPDSLGGPA